MPRESVPRSSQFYRDERAADPHLTKKAPAPEGVSIRTPDSGAWGTRLYWSDLGGPRAHRDSAAMNGAQLPIAHRAFSVFMVGPPACYNPHAEEGTMTDNLSHLPAPQIVLEFHYKPKNSTRPHDEKENTDRSDWVPGSFVPVPSVGDTVSYNAWKATGQDPDDGKNIVAMRKVESRHFYVHQDHICVYIVVTDVSDSERLARVKE
jgi:hypothetical protein